MSSGGNNITSVPFQQPVQGGFSLPTLPPTSPQVVNWGVPTPTNSPYPVGQPMRIDGGFPRSGNPFGGPMSFPPIGYPSQPQNGNQFGNFGFQWPPRG